MHALGLVLLVLLLAASVLLAVVESLATAIGRDLRSLRSGPPP